MRASPCGYAPSWLTQKISARGLSGGTLSKVARCLCAWTVVVRAVMRRAASPAVQGSNIPQPPMYTVLRGRRRTKLPLPWIFSTMPSPWRTARALRNVTVLTLYRSARIASDRRRSPGLMRPVVIWCRRSSVMA